MDTFNNRSLGQQLRRAIQMYEAADSTTPEPKRSRTQEIESDDEGGSSSSSRSTPSRSPSPPPPSHPPQRAPTPTPAPSPPPLPFHPPFLSDPTIENILDLNESNSVLSMSEHVGEQALDHPDQLQNIQLDENSVSEDQKNEFNKRVVTMIVKDFLSLDIVDNLAFFKIIELLNPAFTLPPQRTIRFNIIPDLLNSTRANIEAELAIARHVALSIDIWRWKKEDTYVTFKCHVANTENKLMSYVLKTAKLGGKSYTSLSLLHALNDVMESWYIQSKVIAVVGKNQPKINVAIKAVNKVHVPCTAYSIHKIMKNVLNLDSINNLNENIRTPYGEMIRVCRTIIKCFEQNNSYRATFRQKQERIGATVFELVKEPAPIWNYTVYMLESFLGSKKTLISMSRSLRPRTRMLTASEWSLMNDMVMLMKPFVQFIEGLTKRKCPSLGKVYPLAKGLEYQIFNKVPTTSTGIFMKNTLLNDIHMTFFHSYGHLNEEMSLYSKTTLLDPRFKQAFFLNEKFRQHVKDVIVSEMAELLGSYLPRENTDDPPLIVPEDIRYTLDHLDLTDNDHRIILGKVLFRDYYICDFPSGSSNPIEFWKENDDAFYCLAHVGYKYCCIPSVARSMELTFSALRLSLKEKRNCISPNDLDDMIFLNHNL